MKHSNIYILFSLLLFQTFTFAQKFAPVDIDDETMKNITFDTLDIENNDDFSTFQNFDSLIKTKKIFFTGENHRFRHSNTQLQLKMLKYLHQEVGVRFLMMEFGYSRGWLVDQYVNSTDTATFDILNLYSYKEYADFYKAIRTFNLSLDPQERIHVVGMDLERFTHLPAKVLSLQIPRDKEIPEEIALSIESISALADYNDFMLRENKEKAKSNGKLDYLNSNSYTKYNSRKTLNSVIEDYDKNKELFEAYFGDSHLLFSRVIDELRDHISYNEYSSQPQKQIYRERYMFTKFKRFITEYPEAKIFGQFGRCHTAKENQDITCPWKYFDAFANRLNKDSVLKESVLTFGIYYPNGKDFYRIAKENKYIGKLARKAVEGQISYTKITNDTAVFGKMTDFFDYLIINNISMEEEEKNLEATNDTKSKENKIFIGLSGGVNMLNMSLFPLNLSLQNLGFESLSSTQQEYNFSYYIGKKGSYASKIEYSYLPKTEFYNSSDTTSFSFRGSSWMIKYGWDIFKLDWLYLQPYVGVGYSNYIAEFTPDPTKHDINTNVFGDVVVEKYQNPAFLLDASLDLFVRLKFIAIGGTVGYRYDASNPSWKGPDKKLARQSPDFSSTAPYYGFRVALFFNQ